MKTTLVEFRRGHIEVYHGLSNEEANTKFEQLINEFNATQVPDYKLNSDWDLDMELDFLEGYSEEDLILFGIIGLNFEADLLNDSVFDILNRQVWQKLAYC